MIGIWSDSPPSPNMNLPNSIHQKLSIKNPKYKSNCPIAIRRAKTFIEVLSPILLINTPQNKGMNMFGNAYAE